MVFRFSILKELAALGRGLVDLLFPLPPPCALCGELAPVDAEIPVCRTCLTRLPPIGRARCPRCGRAGSFGAGVCTQCSRSRSALDYSRAYGVYDGYLKSCIHALKYRSDLGVAVALGNLMGWLVARDGRYGRIDLVVPVPLHPRRAAERGYNQAHELAKVIGRSLGVPVAEACERVRETAPQSRLTLPQRRANVRGAFRVIRPELVENRRLLLVDDVWTTGATLSALGLTLKRAGASWCGAVCAAAESLQRDFFRRVE